MSISLSLVISPHARPRPRPRDPARPRRRVGRWLRARGLVGALHPEDAVKTKSGLALSTRTEAALDRLRRRAPEDSAFAGRHALRLRAVEAALAASPSLYVRAELQELPEGPERRGSRFALGELERGSFFDRGRLLASKQHGGAHADAVVGDTPGEPQVALPDPETLDARSIAALRAGDASELDILEEALARTLLDEHAAWMPIAAAGGARAAPTRPRRRWWRRCSRGARIPSPRSRRGGPPSRRSRCTRPCAAPFSPEARRAAPRSKAAAPLAAPAALALRVRCPSLDALYVAEWLDGGPPPRTVDAPPPCSPAA